MVNYSIILLKTTHTHTQIWKQVWNNAYTRGLTVVLFRCKITGTFRYLLFACPYFLIFLKSICLTFYNTKKKYI